MTTPKVRTVKRGDSRFYVSPETGDKVPGVTSILNMLPKPFLQFWAAKVVAEQAVEDLGSLVSMVTRGGNAGAIDYLKGAPRRVTSEAADVGSAAHDAFERLGRGLALGHVSPEVRPFVDHFEKFLDDLQPEFLFLEETVWSDTHAYAGSFDAFAVIDGERVWIDFKTTRSGVHEEVALQLAAYRHADHIIREDGTRVPMPKADAGAVVHVRPEGLRVVPVRCDEEVFETFLHLRRVFDWDTETKKTVLGRHVYEAGYEEVTAPRRRATPAPRRAPAKAAS